MLVTTQVTARGVELRVEDVIVVYIASNRYANRTGTHFSRFNAWVPSPCCMSTYTTMENTMVCEKCHTEPPFVYFAIRDIEEQLEEWLSIAKGEYSGILIASEVAALLRDFLADLDTVFPQADSAYSQSVYDLCEKYTGEF